MPEGVRMRLLVVKTSSLGDILTTMPAVSDAVRAIPGLQIDWVAEEPFAAAPAWHPGVRDTIAVGLRGWRRRPSPGDMLRFLGRLRAKRYDLVIDAQGLAKSAMLTLAARGPSCGFDLASARERPASLLYRRRIRVSRDLHAVDRQRALFSQALGYPLPATPPDFGLPRQKQPATPRLLMLHGASWPTKRWPEGFWSALARHALDAGVEPLLRWHDAKERTSAEAIAAAAPGIRILPAPGLEALRQVIGEASAVVANDSGPAHLAAALGVPGVTLYGATRPDRTGTIGPGQIHLAANFPCSPCRGRTCAYRGPAEVRPACYASVPPALVWGKVKPLLL
jgi:heptosyltransferase-1